MAYIPSDRYLKGLVSEFSVAENSVFGKHKKVPFSNSGLLNHNSINDHSEKLVKEYQIQTPDIKTKSGKLSGGNAQRLILAREISSDPKAILACQPTRGLDVGAKQYIHEKLLEERNSGVGILLISTDLEEILTLSDRIAVIYEGEIMDTISAENAHVERLGMLMAGSV